MMKSNKNIFLTGSLLIVLFLLHNCKTYERFTPENTYLESDKIAKLHNGTDAFYLTNIIIYDSYLEGQYVEVFKVYKKSKGDTVEQEPNESLLVHMYMSKSLSGYKTSEKRIRIPFEDIEVLETYEKNWKKNFAVGIGATIGSAGVTVGIIAGLAAAFKSSCPFIYSWDGQKFNFSGEIFSGAVFPAIERHDYLRLSNIKPDKGKFEFMIVNEVKEIQHINLLELLVIQHEKSVKVLIDKYGDIHAAGMMAPPVQAVDNTGADILKKVIIDNDLQTYNGPGEVPDTSLVQTIELQFSNSEKEQSASLYIRAKNNSWLDYSYMRFHDQLGKYYDRWFIKQQKAKAKDLHQWSFEQKIPLIVYLKRNNGELEYLDHFNVCGPMAFKEDVLPIDLSGAEGEDFTLVLESGFKFWEIDYVGISFDEDIDYEVSCIKPTQGITKINTDVTSMILYDDEQYYLQPEVGDGATISFPAPEMINDKDYTIILHSKGYYDILMDPPDFRPRIRDLKALIKPLAFTRYSRDFYLDVYQHQHTLK